MICYGIDYLWLTLQLSYIFFIAESLLLILLPSDLSNNEQTMSCRNKSDVSSITKLVCNNVTYIC